MMTICSEVVGFTDEETAKRAASRAKVSRQVDLTPRFCDQCKQWHLDAGVAPVTQR